MLTESSPGVEIQDQKESVDFFDAITHLLSLVPELKGKVAIADQIKKELIENLTQLLTRSLTDEERWKLLKQASEKSVSSFFDEHNYKNGKFVKELKGLTELSAVQLLPTDTPGLQEIQELKLLQFKKAKSETGAFSSEQQGRIWRLESQIKKIGKSLALDPTQLEQLKQEMPEREGGLFHFDNDLQRPDLAMVSKYNGGGRQHRTAFFIDGSSVSFLSDNYSGRWLKIEDGPLVVAALKKILEA